MAEPSRTGSGCHSGIAPDRAENYGPPYHPSTDSPPVPAGFINTEPIATGSGGTRAVGIAGCKAVCAAELVPQDMARGGFTRFWITVLKQLAMIGKAPKSD